MKKSFLFCLVLLFVFNQSSLAQGTSTFKAQNGVKFNYEVILPADYEVGKVYELALVFSELNRSEKAHANTLAELKKISRIKNMILLVPEVPTGSSHWISHPIHHGLNDLMSEVRKQYANERQKFHFIGHLVGGRVAQTYSGMSSQYVASVSFVNSTHWEDTKQEYFNGIFSKGFPVFVYDQKEAKSLPIDVSKTFFTQISSIEQALLAIDKRVK